MGYHKCFVHSFLQAYRVVLYKETISFNYSSHSRGVAVRITLVAHVFAACLLVLPLGCA